MVHPFLCSIWTGHCSENDSINHGFGIGISSFDGGVYGTIREHVKNFLHHNFHLSWQYGKDQFGFEIDMGVCGRQCKQ